MSEDLISRQAVLEAIDEIESEVADGDGFQYEKWKQYFCELPSADIDLSGYSDRLWKAAYERGKAEAEPRWVPVTERLPDKNCRCLTTNEAWGAFEVDLNAWIDGQWLYPNEKPVAWMPLPECYRGDGNGE